MKKKTTTVSIKEEVVNELHKPARKNFPRRRTIIKGYDDLWQADLAELQNYAHENRGFKFILVVIDCFSKFLWMEAIKDKTAASVTKAMQTILKRSKRKPKNLQTDQGKEFYNKQFQHLMKLHGINHYSSYSIKKASMAERVIRSIKEKLYKMFSLHGNYKYYDSLTQVASEYNNRKHSVTGMRPCDVTKDKEQILLNTVYSHLKMSDKKKFNVNDVVRISKQKAVFEKGYTPNWSTELFRIKSIKVSFPTVYYLEDMQGHEIKGAFYGEELQKAKYDDVYLVEKVLRRRGNNVFVKWLGLDESNNSWIKKSNVVL